jgi:glycosyltransferase involved in cell wall biosynthesis
VTRPKIAVYTIALNEEKHVERWYNSVKDADYILIADTGSTDRTVEIAQSLGITVVSVSVTPFRFDVARNAALAAVPSNTNYCVSLDMDEVLTEGWREELNDLPIVDSAIYRVPLTWNFPEDGSTGLQYGADRVHSRRGIMWKYAAHELLVTYGEAPTTRGWLNFGIEHRADPTKSRSQYLGMIKILGAEAPESDRAAYYYARELYFHGLIDSAAEEFKRHLALPTATWGPERASSLRHLAKCEPNLAEKYLLLAVAEAPHLREARVELAQLYYTKGYWEQCFEHAQLATDIAEKPLDYFCEEFAWGWLPYDLVAIAAYNLGDKKTAYRYGKIALGFSPEDERLARNMVFYQAETGTE